MKIIYILAVSLLFNFCSIFQESVPHTKNFIPRETDVPGWILSGPPEQNNKKQNEDYGVIETGSAEFYSVSDKNKRIKVEIYKFNSLLNAFGMFSTDRGFDENIRNVKENYYSNNKGIYYLNGEYYIKLLTENDNDTSKKKLDNFLIIISGKMKDFIQKGSTQAYLPLFSDKNSKNKLLFYKNGHTSIPVIENIFIRKKNIFEKDKLIFYSKNTTKFETIILYNKILKSGNPGFIFSKSGNLQLAFKKDKNDKFVFISYHKELIFGVLDADNIIEGKKIIMKLFNELSVTTTN